MSLPWDNNSWEMAAQIVAERSRRNDAAVLTATSGLSATAHIFPPHFRDVDGIPLPSVTDKAQLLVQAVIVLGDRTNEGRLIEAITTPWFDIIALLSKDPNVAFEIPPEKWEEIIAGAYRRAGFEQVTLTPRSGDHGRDVIAIKRGLGQVRVIDQVKAYKPSHLVTAVHVRALMGVLHNDGAAKGFLTTTSDFAPRIREDPLIKPFIPSRLDLINGTMLMERLQELARKSPEND
jgi:restriction system protein